MHVANRGTEDEWSCRCCDPNGFHHHADETCEHVCCDGVDFDNPPHDASTCDLMAALQASLARAKASHNAQPPDAMNPQHSDGYPATGGAS